MVNSMKKFAHTETGAALDPHENDSAEAYLMRFSGDISAHWTVKQVPNSTEHGATDNGDGTFTNPAPPPAPIQPDFKTLTAAQFIAVAVTALGFARIDALLARSRSIEALLMTANQIDRTEGNLSAAFAYLKTGADPLTDAEIAAVDIAWQALV